jgi:hemerythrin-like domain-containing protein
MLSLSHRLSMTPPIPLASLTAPRAAGFDQPFEMLHACHERAHRMLALLGRLAGHVQGHGSDEQARQAATDVMRYFDQAAPQHHRDEELHVFPPLLDRGDAAVAALVTRLLQEHLQMEAGWATLRPVLRRIAQGEVTQLAGAEAAAFDAYAALYARHITAEEDLTYPAALGMLDADALAEMGRDMARRRGVA